MDFRTFKNTFIKDNYSFLYNMPEYLFDLFLYILNMKYVRLNNGEIYITYQDDKMVNYIITIFSFNEDTLLLDKNEFVKNFIEYFQFHPSLIYKIKIPLDNVVAKYFISLYCAQTFLIDIFQSNEQYQEYLILQSLQDEYNSNVNTKNKKTLKLDQYIYDNYVPYDYTFGVIYNNNKDLYFINKEYKSYIHKEIYSKCCMDVYKYRNYKKFYVYNIQGNDKIYYKLFFEKPEDFQRFLQNEIDIREISISLISDVAKNKAVYLGYKDMLKKLVNSCNNIGMFYNIWRKLKDNPNFFLIDLNSYRKISLQEFEKNFNYYYLIQNIRFIFYVLQIPL